MKDGSDPRVVVGVGILLLAGCVALLFDSLGLPAGVYDPLGSATVPQMAATVAAIIILWMTGAAAVRLARGFEPDQAETAIQGSSPWRGSVVIVLTPLYVAAMQAGLIGFGPATSLFLFLAIFILRGLNVSSLVPAAVVAAFVGFGSEWLFTQVLIVDLPT